jgi:hypothetical protein
MEPETRSMKKVKKAKTSENERIHISTLKHPFS